MTRLSIYCYTIVSTYHPLGIIIMQHILLKFLILIFVGTKLTVEKPILQIKIELFFSKQEINTSKNRWRNCYICPNTSKSIFETFGNHCQLQC
jgi:hypothetical protein